jgi:hypothetical protein
MVYNLFYHRHEINAYKRVTQPLQAYQLGDLFLDYATSKKKGSLLEQDDLALSQLWRFYILENISEFPIGFKDTLVKRLKQTISLNGKRNSKEVEELMKKYDIKDNSC